MRNSKMVMLVTLLAGFSIGYLARAMTHGGTAAVADNMRSVSAVDGAPRKDAPARPAQTTGGVTTAPRMSEQSSASEPPISVAADTTTAQEMSANRTAMEDRQRKRYVAGQRRQLQDFFELYGIDEARATQITEALANVQFKVEREFSDASRNGQKLPFSYITDAMSDAEPEIFGEYYDAYQQYKPKQRAHVTVNNFSARLEQPLDLSTKQQLADIHFDARNRQNELNGPITERAKTPDGRVDTVALTREQHRLAIERHQDILSRSARILNDEQQQALAERLALQEEFLSLNARTSEVSQLLHGR